MEDIQYITSRENPRLKHAKNVREGRERDQIFIEGIRLVEESLRSSLGLREAFVSVELLGSERIDLIVRGLQNAGVIVHSVSTKISDLLSDTKNGQGIVALAERPVQQRLNELNPANTSGIPIVLFLETVNNPSNLGAVLRTAEAAGVAGVIVSRGSADPYSAKALRASMGSAFRLPIVTGADIHTVASWARNVGLISTAADVSAMKSHFRTDWLKPRLLVLGSEAHGLDAGTIAEMDELTLIAMENGVESLNLAVASGIILFEANRQKRSS